MSQNVVEFILRSKSDLRGVRQMQAAFTGLRHHIQGALGLLGIGVSVGGFAAGIKSVASFGSKLSDMSDRTGISVDALVVFQQAFKDAGLAAESAGESINRMQRNIVEGVNATENSELGRVFHDLRLDAKALQDLAPEEQFRRIAAAIRSIENPDKRTAAAMGIFGKGGGGLLPLLLNPNAMFEAKSKLGQLPETMSQITASMDKLGDALDSVGNKALQFFSGFIQGFGSDMTTAIDNFNRIDLTKAGQITSLFTQELFGEGFENDLSAFWERVKWWGGKSGWNLEEYPSIDRGPGNMTSPSLFGSKPPKKPASPNPDDSENNRKRTARKLSVDMNVEGNDMTKRGLFGRFDWQALQTQLNLGRETNRLLAAIRDTLRGPLRMEVNP